MNDDCCENEQGGDDGESPPCGVARRMRYRVVVTILDQHAGKSTVELYDTNTLDISRGPLVPDPCTVHLVQDVQIRLPAAVCLAADAWDGS